MPRLPFWLALPAAASRLACASGGGPGVSASGGCAGICRSSTTGRPRLGSSSGGSSTGGSTGGGSSSSGGGTLGTSTGGGSSGGGPFQACQSVNPATCPQYLCAQVYDYTSDNPVSQGAGISIGAFDANGLPVSLTGQLTTIADGSFLACAPAGVPFTLTASGSSYHTTYTSQIELPAGSGLSPYFDQFGQQLPVFTTGEYTGFAVAVGAKAQDSIVVAAVGSVGGANCPSPSGYVLTVQLPDGGALLEGGDGGYAVDYVVNGFPDLTHSATETTDGGNGFLYNLDPTLTPGYVTVVATAQPDATCSDAGPIYAAMNMTGLAAVGPGSFTLTAVPIP